jgi:hypothetical protein
MDSARERAVAVAGAVLVIAALVLGLLLSLTSERDDR